MLNAEADNENSNVTSTASTTSNESSPNLEPEDKWLVRNSLLVEIM